MWAGCYENDLLAFLRHMLEPGFVFVDIGANMGYFSIIGAALVGGLGAVHSFEPDPDCYSRLVQNSVAYPWITAYHGAVSDREGEIPFYPTNRQGESGWGTMFDDGTARLQITVPVCSLDSYCGNGRVGRIDLIKIDVEGSEYRVLVGGRCTLETSRPMVWIEANGVCLARDGRSVLQLVRLLHAWGFLLLTPEDGAFSSIATVVAIPKERQDLVAKATSFPPDLSPIRLPDEVSSAISR